MKTENVTAGDFLVGIPEAAARLSISTWTLRAWIRANRIQAVRLSTRIMLPSSEIERIIKFGVPRLKKNCSEKDPI